MFFPKEMETFGFFQGVLRRLDFNRNVGISQNNIDLSATCRSPKCYRKIQSTVMPVGPAFLKNEMFKCPAMFGSARGQGFVTQEG